MGFLILRRVHISLNTTLKLSTLIRMQTHISDKHLHNRGRLLIWESISFKPLSEYNQQPGADIYCWIMIQVEDLECMSIATPSQGAPTYILRHGSTWFLWWSSP